MLREGGAKKEVRWVGGTAESNTMWSEISRSSQNGDRVVRAEALLSEFAWHRAAREVSAGQD